MPQPGPRPLLSFRIGDQPVPGYRLVRELGRGTFGVVWLAVTDNGFERALKVVNLEQRGGKKEFRALRLIKDRKILHGNLLMLVDYWLLDREGTILNTANDPTLESQIAPKSGGSGGTGSKVKSDQGAQVQVTNLPMRQGTMLPQDGEDSGPLSVRDTFAQNRIGDTREEESSAAIWLIVAMELGHKTLHDRQKEHTVEERSKNPSKVNRKRATHLDRKVDTSPGSNTVDDEGQRRQEDEEDEELFPLPAEEVLPYMEQAARGLDHLHRNEIVHRDVKPQNIMLVGDVAKVCDYGLASELNDIRATTNAFTLPYAASEAINKRPTPASDQYSLAVTYVELRTGRWPFPSNTQTAVFACKDSGVHDLRCIRKRGVRLVLKKALAKNPKDRYPTCGDFVRELAVAENSKSSIFAMAQGLLAVMAIITVLMAAVATHPDVRKWLGAKAQEFGWIGRQAPPDLEGLKRDLQSAEELLQDPTRLADARSKYENLAERRTTLPDGQQALHVDIIQGLCRSLIGASKDDKEPSEELIESIKGYLADLSALNYDSFSDQQTLRKAYFEQILARKSDDSNSQNKPGSPNAASSLSRWEIELWSTWTTPHTKSHELLAKLIEQRKLPTGLKTARVLHGQLINSYKLEPTTPGLKDEIDLEHIHLNHLADTDTPDNNLKDLQVLTEELEKNSSLLKSRAYLLQLLILKKQRDKSNSELHLFDKDVCTLVAKAPADIYTLKEADRLTFSKVDGNIIQQLRARFEQEVIARQNSLVEGDMTALDAVIKLFDRSKCLTVLMDRVKARLMNRQDLTEMQLMAVTSAWNDLQVFLSRSYKNPDKEINEDDGVRIADLALDAALVNPHADPNQSLLNFAGYFRKASGSKQSDSLETLLKRGEGDPAWTNAALVPLRELLNNPPPGLQSDLSQIDEWKRRLNVLVYQEVLMIDPANTTLLRSKLTDLPRGELRDVLTIELEMAETVDPSPELLKGWQEQVKRALDAGDWSASDHRQLINLLVARLQSARGAELTGSADKNFRELLSQKKRPVWFTDWRRQGAEGIFLQLALKELKASGAGGSAFDDSLVTRFADLQPLEMPKLAELQSQAAMFGLNVELLNMIDAVRQATHRQKADWGMINATLKSRSAAQETFFDQQGCGRLIRYVTALSALNSLPSGATMPDEVVQAFDQLLHTAPGKLKPYFEYGSPAKETDSGVLKNIVNLFVQHPLLTDATAQGKPAEIKQALARLWAAKGRILQRSPDSVVVDEKRMMGTRDFLMPSTLLAYEAFQKARMLDDQLSYAVGFGRMARFMPAQSLKANSLDELIQKYDPQGIQTDPGMQYLFAFNLRMQGMRESDIAKKRDLLHAAIERFSKLSKQVDLPEDTWQLAELCQESLSDAHLNLAFITEIKSAEDVRAVANDQEPTADTRPYHLYWAAKHAQRYAELDPKLVQRPEHAALELGNAYEDFAHYLYLTDYFPKSITEFKRAIQILTDDNRDLADAQFNYGRCLFRFAAERNPPPGVPRDSVQLLQTAIEHLTEAAESKNLIPGRQAETRMWLAHCQKELYVHRDKIDAYKQAPASARALLHQAANQFGLAAKKSGEENFLRHQFMYLTMQFETLGSIRSNQLSAAEKQSLSDQLQKVEDEAFTLFLAKGELLVPGYAGTFAKNAGYRLSPQTKEWEQPSALLYRWLDGTRQREIWSSSNIWLYEEFLIRMQRAQLARLPANKAGELRKAELIVPQIAALDPATAVKAEGQLEDMRAEAALATFKTKLAAATNEAGVKEAVIELAPHVIASARTRMKIKANDAAAKVLRDKLSSTSVSDLKAASLTLYEQRALFNEVKRFAYASTSWDLGSALMKIFEDSKAGKLDVAISPEEAGALALDSLKPFYALPEDDPYIKGSEAARTPMKKRIIAAQDFLRGK